mmetsp:Transcript_27991/g.65377  ORF Transcript_27991/g.65377 Transcript_27991/m.65377 type:complete len:206 (+) Transcript_27991:2168-2785(+)
MSRMRFSRCCRGLRSGMQRHSAPLSWARVKRTTASAAFLVRTIRATCRRSLRRTRGSTTCRSRPTSPSTAKATTRGWRSRGSTCQTSSSSRPARLNCPTRSRSSKKPSARRARSGLRRTTTSTTTTRTSPTSPSPRARFTRPRCASGRASSTRPTKRVLCTRRRTTGGCSSATRHARQATRCSSGTLKRFRLNSSTAMRESSRSG